MTEEIQKAEYKLLVDKFSTIRYLEAKILRAKEIIGFGSRWEEIGPELISLEAEYLSLEDEDQKIRDRHYRSAIDHLNEAKKDKKKGWDTDFIDHNWKWKRLLESIKEMEVYVKTVSIELNLTVPSLEDKLQELEKIEKLLEKNEQSAEEETEYGRRINDFPETTIDISLIGRDLTDLSVYLDNEALNTREVVEHIRKLTNHLLLSDAEQPLKIYAKNLLEKTLGRYQKKLVDDTLKDQIRGFRDDIKSWYDERTSGL